MGKEYTPQWDASEFATRTPAEQLRLDLRCEFAEAIDYCFDSKINSRSIYRVDALIKSLDSFRKRGLSDVDINDVIVTKLARYLGNGMPIHIFEPIIVKELNSANYSLNNETLIQIADKALEYAKKHNKYSVNEIERFKSKKKEGN